MPEERSGWFVGIVLGVWLGLYFISPVRETLMSQLSFALSARPQAWSRPVTSTLSDIARLDVVASAAPNDYLIQVGRAAVIPAQGVRLPTNDRPLHKMVALMIDFPRSPGAAALLLRYLLASDNELMAEGRTMGLQRRALLAAVIDRGAQLDPSNAFWDAMRAASSAENGDFAQAVEALGQERTTTTWDAYLYEQVLGQWRLYSLAYGDHGAAQKVAPLSLVAFPYLQAIRDMAISLRAYANRLASAGHEQQAIVIRHLLLRLGQKMRSQAPWAYEALVGTDITLLAATDTTTRTGAIRHTAQWPPLAHKLLVDLKTAHRNNEALWMEHEVKRSLEVRNTVSLARDNSSYPGVPPGIPIVRLFGSWVLGVCLLQQQMAVIVVLAAATAAWGAHYVLSKYHISLVLLACAAAFALTLLTANGLAGGLFILCVEFAALQVLDGLWYRSRLDIGTGTLARARREWTSAVSCSIAVPASLAVIAALRFIQPVLAREHPVAQLLTSLVQAVPPATFHHALLAGLQIASVPELLLLAAAIWAVARDLPPAYTVYMGFRRMAPYALLVLLLGYLFVTRVTLISDSAASKAITQAAANDRHWVLTHAEPQ